MTRCPDCQTSIVWVRSDIGVVPLETRQGHAFRVIEGVEDDLPIAEAVKVYQQHRCANPRREYGRDTAKRR